MRSRIDPRNEEARTAGAAWILVASADSEINFIQSDLTLTTSMKVKTRELNVSPTPATVTTSASSKPDG